MQITTGLLTKGLMGLGAIAGVVTGSVFLFKKGEEPAKVSAVSALPPPPKPTFKEKINTSIKDTGIENSWFSGNGIDGLETDDVTLPFDTSKVSENLKKLKFTDGTNDLKIFEDLGSMKSEIQDTKETDIFPGGVLFLFENQKDITLKRTEESDEGKIVFKKRTNPQFKLVAGGKLQPAWTIETLGEKVGLDCKENKGQKTCTLKEGKTINVWETKDKKVEDVTFTGELKWEEDQAEHNQGFKLTPTGNITLKKEGETSLPISSLSSSTSYDIKFIDASDDDGDVIKWYLRKYNANHR